MCDSSEHLTRRVFFDRLHDLLVTMLRVHGKSRTIGSEAAILLNYVNSTPGKKVVESKPKKRKRDSEIRKAKRNMHKSDQSFKQQFELWGSKPETRISIYHHANRVLLKRTKLLTRTKLTDCYQRIKTFSRDRHHLFNEMYSGSCTDGSSYGVSHAKTNLRKSFLQLTNMIADLHLHYPLIEEEWEQRLKIDWDPLDERNLGYQSWKQIRGWM
jgi:hypothetical protein